MVKQKHGFLLLVCLLLFLPSCSFGGQPKGAATPTMANRSNLPSLTPGNLQSLKQTEQIMLMTPHPLRDLYSLAQRFKLHTATPIPHVGRTTPINGQVGQEDAFWVSNLDTRRYTRISAKLVYITAHVYMYVEDGQQVDLTALQSSANLFETKIYPTDHNTFGSEWSPGIDDDVHLRYSMQSVWAMALVAISPLRTSTQPLSTHTVMSVRCSTSVLREQFLAPLIITARWHMNSSI